MIPEAYILAWAKNAPWPTMAQIEQDLVIEKALIELFSNPILQENLAFRGGTTLHKLFLKPQVRYSEDIDLVQIKPGPIKPLLIEIQKAMSFIGQKRNFKQNANMNTVYYRFHTEIQPVIRSRLKLEINTREHFSVFGFKKVKHTHQSPWFSGEVELATYEIEELLGTKLRALYQRSKGRDLFDLSYALQMLQPDVDKIIAAYKVYMKHDGGRAKTARELMLNLGEKMKDSNFYGDVKGILRPGIKFDHQDAYELVKTKLIKKI